MDSRDPAMELGGDPAPLQSLQEEQLLVVADPSANPREPAHRKSSYKVLLPGTNKENRATTSPTNGRELRALQKFGFDETLSEKIPLRRALPDTRHPE